MRSNAKREEYKVLVSRRGSPLVFKLVRAELSWHKPRKHDDGTNHGNTTWFVPSSFNVHRRSWAVSTPFLQSPCSDRMVCASDQCVRESIYIHTDIIHTHTRMREPVQVNQCLCTHGGADSCAQVRMNAHPRPTRHKPTPVPCLAPVCRPPSRQLLPRVIRHLFPFF